MNCRRCGTRSTISTSPGAARHDCHATLLWRTGITACTIFQHSEMATTEPINSNPKVLEQWELPQRREASDEFSAALLEATKTFQDFSLYDQSTDLSQDKPEPIDPQEIYDLISCINDPEHPLTLGQLAVVGLDRIEIIQENGQEIKEVLVHITPTITHCSLATLIGLGIRVRLERCLPPNYRIKLLITPGTHQSERQVNKQLNDKERVAAACENDQLLKVIEQMLANC